MPRPVSCPCGSNKEYEICCEPFHKGNAIPDTAEALMRSRYSAFAKSEISYLKDTTWPPYQKSFDEAVYHTRATQSLWVSLRIVETDAGTKDDTKGMVSFEATSMIQGKLDKQSEKSSFKKKAGRWYYVAALA